MEPLDSVCFPDRARQLLGSRGWRLRAQGPGVEDSTV